MLMHITWVFIIFVIDLRQINVQYPPKISFNGSWFSCLFSILGRYVPITTHVPFFPENDDSYYTAPDGNNEFVYENNEYEDNDDYDLMFPEKSPTQAPPPRVITFMPINPAEDDEGETEVRYDDKVVL